MTVCEGDPSVVQSPLAIGYRLLRGQNVILREIALVDVRPALTFFLQQYF